MSKILSKDKEEKINPRESAEKLKTIVVELFPHSISSYYLKKPH